MSFSMKNSPRIIVNSDVLAPAAMKLLAERGADIRRLTTHAPESDLIKAVSEAPTHAILARSTPITAAVMDAAPDLRVISKHGVGYDNIDVAAAKGRGIAVLRAYAANARSVAELALGMMLVLLRRMMPLDAAIREGRWAQSALLGRELSGAKLGVIGCGAVGSSVVALGRPFGLSVRIYDPYIEPALVPAGVERVHLLDEILAWADIVTLHCPLTAETDRIIDARALARMKPGSFLINAGRGQLVDDEALVKALEDGKLAGAGLDTFMVEPPPADHPLWKQENVIFTPHVGGSTEESMNRVAVQAVENIFTILEGNPPNPRCVVG
jgi:D-3-phosphoglycerate dehydrogenase